MAEEELKLNMVPFKIKRPLPNGKYEIWLLEELNKEHVFIQTKLKHCTEWFIEHGYDVRKVNEMHDYGFSGLKTIKKLTNSTIGDFIQ